MNQAETAKPPPLASRPMDARVELPTLPDRRGIAAFVFRAIDRLESRFGVVGAALCVAVAAELISVLVAGSWYTQHAGRFTSLADHPFAPGDISIPYPEHRLRLLGPVIAWALGLHGLPGTLIPVVANIPLLMIVYAVLRRRTDLPIAVTATLLLATTHLTMTSRTLLGYHDSLVFLCILAAMVSRPLWLSATMLFLALWGDVRAIEVVPFLLIWRATMERDIDLTRCAVVRGGTYAAVFILWLVAATALLHLLQYEPQSQARMALYVQGKLASEIKLGYLHLAGFMTFKAAWVFPVLLCWVWSKQRLGFAAVIACTGLFIALSSLLLDDYSRALTFCFPLVIIGIIELWKARPADCLTVTATCLLVNLITPFYQGMTKGLWVISFPLPVELAKRLLAD